MLPPVRAAPYRPSLHNPAKMEGIMLIASAELNGSSIGFFDFALLKLKSKEALMYLLIVKSLFTRNVKRSL